MCKVIRWTRLYVLSKGLRGSRYPASSQVGIGEYIALRGDTLVKELTESIRSSSQVTRQLCYCKLGTFKPLRCAAKNQYGLLVRKQGGGKP